MSYYPPHFLHQRMMTWLLIHHLPQHYKRTTTNFLDIKMKDPKKWSKENPLIKSFLVFANNMKSSQTRSLQMDYFGCCVQVVVTILRTKY